MIIKLPERVPVPTAIAFGSLILVAQVVEGTSIILAVLGFTFLMLSVFAFNVAGGMVYPSGSYVGVCATLTVLVGMVAKVALGEPMQRNLLVPETTMMVYVAAMSSMLAAAYVNSLLRPKRALLDGMVVEGNATRIGLACVLVSVVTPLLLPDDFQGTFIQANYFLYLAILIPVFDTVRSTEGRRSFNMVAFAAWLYSTANGIVTFSKQATFISSAAWAIAAVAAGYRVSFGKVVAVGVLAAVAVGVITPLSQVGRNFGRDAGPIVGAEIAIGLLSHPLDLRQQYQDHEEEIISDSNNYHMFDGPEGLLDRLTMFPIDDALVAVTEKGSTASPANLWSYFVNLVPRYVYRDKPTLHYGNIYAHELNILGDEDDTTGVSFSPFSDGYHTAQWLGVTLYSFAIFLFGFFLSDAVAGNAKHSLWALIYVLYNLHGAPEGLLGTPVYEGFTLSIFVTGLAIICTKIVPVLSNMIAAPTQKPARRLAPGDSHVQSA